MEMKVLKMYFIILIFGGIAIVLALMALIVKNKKAKLLQYLSLSSGLLAMYCTIYDYDHLISIQDWNALLDTSWFISKITFVIMCVVIVLNFIVYMKNK